RRLPSLDDRNLEELETSHTPARPSTQGLETLSAAALYVPEEHDTVQGSGLFAEGDMEDLRLPHVSMDSGILPAMQTTQLPSIDNLDHVMNPVSSLSTTIDPSLEAFGSTLDIFTRQRPGNARAAQMKASTETDRKVAFLLRHFSETTGRWMDPFDRTTFFAHHVPVKSISNPLLKHAACAFAAKQLARTKRTAAVAATRVLQQASEEMRQNAANEDWAVVAAQHYEQAISLLLEALDWTQSPDQAVDTEEIDKRHYGPRTVEGMVEERRLRRRQFGSARSTARSDDVLIATAILCEYESLDASTSAWARHLSGTKSLLDVVEFGVMPLDTPPGVDPFSVPASRQKPSQARKAVFWNFARQDLFSAFVNECQTRLDTEDVAMWRDAGLELDENGLISTDTQTDSGNDEGHPMREDVLGNAFIWLLSKLDTNDSQMNLICLTTSDESAANRSHTDLHSPTLAEKWKRLNYEMEIWNHSIPETFMPSSIIPAKPHGTNLTEVWHSIPVCAATILSWHFAQILILTHKPEDVSNRRTTGAARLKSYRSLQTEIEYHSHQILGLCLARPEAAIRIHALQPLYTAGQCLNDDAERRVVLDLLRGIEEDLGWATDYRVQQLLQELGWNNDDLNEE
ncbi:MAG: hypothetical protein Q9174_006687, partial [Haloplaca sp. 1 TL-2023]